MHTLNIPKPWRTRFMEGLEIEWREHGGGMHALDIGMLVLDHLNEDADYYRHAAQAIEQQAERAAWQEAHEGGRSRYNPQNAVELRGDERLPYVDAVWAMYQKSYEKIGLIVGRGEELLVEYDVWEISFDGAGNPVAFCLYKSTPYGLKVGLSGSDGSAEGRVAARASFTEKYFRPGVYGEVSHRPAELAKQAGAPVVCSNLAPIVLRKDVEFVDDLHYVRTLAGVGPVKKILVGSPIGVPTTNVEAPVCPAVRMNPSQTTPDDMADVDAHYANVLFDV